MKLASDIEKYLTENFSNSDHAKQILNDLEIEIEKERIIRSILFLSENDYDALEFWVKRCNKDHNEVIRFAENDNHELKKFDFTLPLDEQVSYSYCKWN